jgi:hypothetical protein
MVLLFLWLLLAMIENLSLFYSEHDGNWIKPQLFSVTRESRMLIKVWAFSLSSSWFSDLIPEWAKLELI